MRKTITLVRLWLWDFSAVVVQQEVLDDLRRGLRGAQRLERSADLTHELLVGKLGHGPHDLLESGGAEGVGGVSEHDAGLSIGELVSL